MRAYQLVDWKQAGFREVELPEPGRGQVRVRIGGAGLCQRHPVRHRVERFGFDETPFAYERLRAGDLAGRAVVLPSESQGGSGPPR